MKSAATENDIEDSLKHIIDKTTFVNGVKILGSVRVRFTTEDLAIEHSTKTIRSENVISLPTYSGRRNVRVCTGKKHARDKRYAWLLPSWQPPKRMTN